MIKTPNLDLPIYDKPSTDTFKVADWNKANENIDYVFGEFKNNPNVNAIDIKAREDIINNHREVTEQLDSIESKKADKSYTENLNSKIDEVANKGTTIEVVENTTRAVINQNINNGTISALTIKDQSIKLEKLNNTIVALNNLYNKTTTLNGYVDRTNGNFIATTDTSYASDFIPCLPTTKYFKNSTATELSSKSICYYTSNKIFISGEMLTPGVVSFTTPSNCGYFRFNTDLEHKDIERIYKDGDNRGVINTNITLDSSQVDFNVNKLPIKNIDGFKLDLVNYYNKGSLTDICINSEFGNQYTDPTSKMTDYISVDANNKIIRNWNNKKGYAFFDYNKQLISNSQEYITGKYEFYIPNNPNIKFIKLVVHVDDIDKGLIINVIKSGDVEKYYNDNISVKYNNLDNETKNIIKNSSSSSNRRLVFFDDFETLNTENWGYEIGNVRNHDIEAQCYKSGNVSIENSNLVLTAKKENYGGKTWTSGSIITNNLHEFRYGKIEIKAKLPGVIGSWPAFWTKGANNKSIFKDGDVTTSIGVPWPVCGEIDIFEQYDTTNKVEGTVHYGDANGNHVTSGSTLSNIINLNDYNIFGIEWTFDKIIWTCNDVIYKTFNIDSATYNNINPFRLSHFLMINLAVKNTATVSEMKMYVDWVKVYADKYENVPSQLQLNNTSLSMNIGDTKILYPIVDSGKSDTTIKWSSSNENIATCYGGYVKAISSGATTIRATLKNGVSAFCSITVS